jgi:hypothetical protein
MSAGKRIFLLAGVLAAAAADILFFGGSCRVARAARLSDPTARIRILAGERSPVDIHDVLYRELGRAAFEAAVVDLTAAGPRDEGLRTAYAAQSRSLAINPLSAATHFDLAQTVEYMRLFDLPAEEKPLDEYVKVVRLAGQDPEILAQTARVLLSSWASIGPRERDLAQYVTRSVLAIKFDGKLNEVLDLWALRIRDPGFMRAVLPPDPGAYRSYAQFLAERGLERGERIHFLAEAEALDLARAGQAAGAGRSELLAGRMKEAETHYRSARDLLSGICFYGEFDPSATAVSASAVRDLRRAALLGIARCRLEVSRSLEDILPELKDYLAVEGSSAAVAELEKSLRQRRLIEEKPDSSGRDLRRLAFELELVYRQNRYREVIAYGQTLEAGLVMITEAVRPDYAAILETVGDAYHKLDFLYESNRFYQKARESAPVPDPRLLEKMIKNHERLNDTAAVAALRREEAGRLSARVLDWTGVSVPKGTAFRQQLIWEARESRLTLKASPHGPLPIYATIILNGRVVWENFISGAPVLLDLTPEAGANELEITPWNGPLLLAGLEVDSQAGEPAGKAATGNEKAAIPSRKKAAVGR